jgi:F-type H+-transporting ATPase subunit a
MSTRRKLTFGLLGVYLLGFLVIIGIFGAKRQDNTEFLPQNEFKLDTWLDLPGPLDLNKGVLYLLIATTLTMGTMLYVSKRMQAKPNRLQTAVEWLYTGMKDKLVKDNMDDDMARKWFPLVCTLFVFIWFSNMIGYLPLPVNTEHKVDIFGLELPALAIYAATANISIPLILTLIVWFSYHVEGIRAKGFVPYFKSWLPPGLEEMNPIGRGAIFMIEVISHFVRLISLSVRLFANILAGHLLLLFMGGGLAVLLGIAALGALTFPLAFAFFIFEVGLVATLQAFIFATLTAIYIGGATSAEH